MVVGVDTHSHVFTHALSRACAAHQADLHELQIACNKLSAMISEYEHIKGQGMSTARSVNEQDCGGE